MARQLLSVVFLALASLSVPFDAEAALDRPNVLLIVADDVGIEHLSLYGIGTDGFAKTPNLTALSAQGLVFDNAWADPICSPSRVRIQTGRYGLHDGVGYATHDNAWGLHPESAGLLAKRLRDEGGYQTAAFGKWHMGVDPDRDGVPNDDIPNRSGYDEYKGILAHHQDWSDVYNTYNLTIDGAPPISTSDPYLTTGITDWAVNWIHRAQENPEPWFAYVGYLSAHAPFTCPPAALLEPSDSCLDTDSDRHKYRLMIQAMDTEIDRLLTEIGFYNDDETLLIVVSDNGSPTQVAADPVLPDRAKGTVYQGGVRVPLMMVGHAVRAVGERVSSMVDLTDLHATILQIGLGPVSVPAESISMMPYLTDAGYQSRQCSYAQWHYPNYDPAGDGGPSAGSQAVRGSRYKIVRGYSGNSQFYDLLNDPWEETDLFEIGLSSSELAEYEGLDGCLEAIAPGGLRSICKLLQDGATCTSSTDCCSEHCSVNGSGTCYSPLITP